MPPSPPSSTLRGIHETPTGVTTPRKFMGPGTNARSAKPTVTRTGSTSAGRQRRETSRPVGKSRNASRKNPDVTRPIQLPIHAPHSVAARAPGWIRIPYVA